MNEEKLAKIRAEHGDEVYVIGEGDHAIVVRMPRPAEFERCVGTMEKGAPKAMAQLVRDCLLYPSRDEYNARLEKRPGLALAQGKAVFELTGALLELEAKKA